MCWRRSRGFPLCCFGIVMGWRWLELQRRQDGSVQQWLFYYFTLQVSLRFGLICTPPDILFKPVGRQGESIESLYEGTFFSSFHCNRGQCE